MIGATGSFEVLELMDGKEISTHSNAQIDLANCKQILDRIIASNWEERKAMPKMPHERSLLIVVACVLIRKLLKIFSPEKLMVSPYALKEGKLLEMMK
jgi:exopolyphosphatase/guanosine-5'-triphosphate,3'-diphosphate pyrophosphatase